MIYCFTLAYNLIPMIEESINSLYELNDNFHHIIVDVGFPLIIDEKPSSIKEAKEHNTSELKRICSKYGSEYLQIENIGVSQNWNAVIKHLNISKNDVIIGVDPDERPQNKNWLNAMAEVLSVENIGMTALMITDHVQYVSGWAMEEKSIGPINYYEMHGFVNMALIGFSGRFLDIIKEIPIPPTANVYGHIETTLNVRLAELGYYWAITKDYTVEHLWSCKLLNDWKGYICAKADPNQLSFEQYLNL